MKLKILLPAILLLFFSSLKTMPQLASGIPFQFFAVDSISPALTPTLINLSTRQAHFRDEFDTLLTIPFAFDFEFACERYSKIILSTNGWLALAPISMTSLPPYFSNSALPNNSLSTYSGGIPLIAPLWDDDSCTALYYGIQANILTVKWLLKWDKTNTGTYTSLVWVVLNPNTGTIEFNYSNAAYVASQTASASIGIAGVCEGDFYSVTPDTINSLSFIDSIFENVSINTKPINARYIFTPSNFYDNCSNARFMGTLDSSCVSFPVTTCNASSSGSGLCSTSDANDIWFSFFKPAGVSEITIRTMPDTSNCSLVSGTSMEVFSDSCNSSALGCATSSSSNPDFAKVSLMRPINLTETLLVRITADNDVGGKFMICGHVSDTTVSVQEIETISSFNVYPNPVQVNEKLFLKLNHPNAKEGIVEINDMTGKIIFSKQLTSGYFTHEISTAKLYPGIYLVKLKLENSISIKKLLVR